MYACIVKNSEGTWDVWKSFSYPAKFIDRQERVDAALASSLPIVGKNLTQYGSSVKTGAVWNGTGFTGGNSATITEGSNTSLYSYVCDGVILLTFYGEANTENNTMMSIIFSEEEETTIIKVPEGQIAKKGDIWDGEKIVNLV
jgi:hypothetical protein